MESFFFSSFLVWWKESFMEEQNVFLWSEEHLKQEIHDTGTANQEWQLNKEH